MNLAITMLFFQGLWGKLLTGPWMSVFYSSEETRDHLGHNKYLESAVKFCGLAINMSNALY